jgi:predicted lactoylglutathione lyase
MFELIMKIAKQLSGVLFQSAKMSDRKIIGFTFDSSADCRDFVNQAKEAECPSVWRSTEDSKMCFCSQSVVEVGDIQF